MKPRIRGTFKFSRLIPKYKHDRSRRPARTQHETAQWKHPREIALESDGPRHAQRQSGVAGKDAQGRDPHGEEHGDERLFYGGLLEGLAVPPPPPPLVLSLRFAGNAWHQDARALCIGGVGSDRDADPDG